LVHDGGQKGASILVALAVAYEDCATFEVEIRHPQPQAPEQAQSPAMERRSLQPGQAAQAREQGFDLAAPQHHRQVVRSFGSYDVVEPLDVAFEDVPVEEADRRQRLVLGRGAGVAVHGQGGEEGFDFALAHVGGMTLAVEDDEAADPVHVGLLGAQRVVTGTHGFADAVEQTWALAGDGRKHRSALREEEAKVKHGIK
jgi:hypothetical protein